MRTSGLTHHRTEMELEALMHRTGTDAAEIATTLERHADTHVSVLHMHDPFHCPGCGLTVGAHMARDIIKSAY